MSWKYTDGEYIKVFRKLLEWEWYTDVNTTKLFMHCLLKANWKAGSWHGFKYERGQFITSLATLAHESGLTVKEVRTALNHLERTGEVASKKYPKFRVITVLSFNKFQSMGKQTGKQRASSGQGKGKQGATDIRSIRSIRSKEEKEAPPIFSENDETDEAEGWGYD